MQYFSVRRARSAPQIAGFHTILGESLVVQVRWPGGGWVWNTPVAVHVQRRGHTVTRRVIDTTRLAQFGLALLTIAVITSRGRTRKEDSDA